jgi:hypothetical protein
MIFVIHSLILAFYGLMAYSNFIVNFLQALGDSFYLTFTDTLSKNRDLRELTTSGWTLLYTANLDVTSDEFSRFIGTNAQSF